MTPEEEKEFLGRWETDGGRPLGILNTPGITVNTVAGTGLTLDDFLKAVEAVKKMR